MTFSVTNNTGSTLYVGRVKILKERTAVFEHLTPALSKAIRKSNGLITVVENKNLALYYTIVNNEPHPLTVDGAVILPNDSEKMDTRREDHSQFRGTPETLDTQISEGPLVGAANQGGGGGGGITLELYAENPATPPPPSPLGVNSIALGAGAQVEAGATNAIAIGSQALARHMGGQAFANGRFGSSGDCQVGNYILRNATNSASPVELFLDGVGGSARLTLTDDSTWTFKVTVTGHRIDVGDGHAGYTFRGVIFRRAGAASVLFQGNPVKSVISESNPAWDAKVIADSTNGSLKIEVVGQAGKTVRWASHVETLEVTN
jgi:hypothetical protein